MLRAPRRASTNSTSARSSTSRSCGSLDRHWKVTGGYCHFWAGDFIEATGPSDDVYFFWLDAEVTF